MIATDLTILNILSNEMFDSGRDVPEPGNWNDVVSIASKHGIAQLLYKEISKIDTVPENILLAVRSKVLTSIYMGEQVFRVQDELLAVLNSGSIPCAVYKGASVADCYPHPDLRPHGDIDILVRQCDAQRAMILLESFGFMRHNANHDFHAHLLRNGVHIELHHAVSCFPDSEVGQYCIGLFASALDQTAVATINNWIFPVLLPKFQLLSLLFHMARHITGSCIGLRQFCDWAACIHHYRDTIDQEMLNAFSRCGVLKFAKVLTQACTHFLGMPQLEWSRDVTQTMVSQMMNDILDGGIFILATPERLFSSMFVGACQTDGSSKSWVASWFHHLNRIARTRHPATGRFPILLPVFWVFIPLKSMIRSLRSGRRKRNVIQILSIARKRRKLHRELAIFVNNT